MGHTNSKVIPSNILEEEDNYFTCKECNLKIHSSCKKYYLKKKIDFSICINCHNKINPDLNLLNNYKNT